MHMLQIMAADGDHKPFLQSKTDGQTRGALSSIGSVIDAYKANVDVMAGLLLQLDQQQCQQEPSTELMQNIRQAVMTSVRDTIHDIPIHSGICGAVCIL